MTAFVMPEFAPLAAEIFVLSAACFILVLDLFLSDRVRIVSYWLSQLTLVGALAIVGMTEAYETRTLAMFGTFVADPLAALSKSAIFIVTLGVFAYSRSYLKDRALFKGEYYVLGLFGVLGMMVLISAHSLLTLYLGLELLALSLYALVAFHRDSAAASEAAMKYFVLGAMASGLLLYGMSILYGVTGSIDLEGVAQGVREATDTGARVALAFGLVFIVIGVAFKLGAVPFHMWIPDVYQGAPSSVTLYIGSAPKIAAFAMAMRLLAEANGPMQADWGGMLAILAVLSLFIGNVVAIAQTNIKRMLAYSTISHVGFLMLGLLAGTPDGYGSALFYAVTYALMAAGGFGMVVLLSRAGFEAEALDDYRGLNQRSPWLAFMMLVLMFSMAGVPPTVGFYAKLAVLQAVINVDMVWLALVAVVFSIIGAFYYLRLVKLMYFDDPAEAGPLAVAAEPRFVISVNGLAVLWLGLFPGTLMAACMAAIPGT